MSYAIGLIVIVHTSTLMLIRFMKYNNVNPYFLQVDGTAKMMGQGIKLHFYLAHLELGKQQLLS